jgi:predicted acetyltransferase
MPCLTLPTTFVRDSYLQGETETAIAEGLPTGWLEEAAADFAGFVAQRRAVRELWGVPVTELWFVDGADYLGTVLIRHRLTAALERAGGHIGYHVVPGHRRRGYATRCSLRPSWCARIWASARFWSAAPRTTSALGG